MLCQQCSILHLRTLHQLTIHHYVQIFIRLVFYGLNNRRVPMAYITHTDTTYKIQVLLTVNIVQVIARCLHYLYTYRCWRCLGYVLLEELAGVHLVKSKLKNQN